MLRVAILVDFGGGYGRGVLRGLMQFANLRSDWEFIIPPMYALTDEDILSTGTSGIVAMFHEAKDYKPYRRVRMPVVNVARTMTEKQIVAAKLPSVLPADRSVGELALQYFYERGYRSFGFCGHPTASWSLERLAGFVGACDARGLPCSHALSDRVPVEWLLSLPRPCAILAANDRYAWHAVDLCREHNIVVPETIAVLGCDNDPLLTEMARPSLSSIDLDAEHIGLEAGRLLQRLMEGKAPPEKPINIEARGIITRNSTDALSIDDEVVASSARFIRGHAGTILSVDDVCDHVAISRRNLERRFRRLLGRSILDEIWRVHLFHAMKLLRETDLDMPCVAEQSGFSSHVRFSTLFRQQTGMTPTAYRRKQRLVSIP